MANNDDQMKRFLFAILKQKNLKDIDWNQVAHDPVLSQPITNGHAARMRYSRFRQQMLGLEPQKRNRNGPAKSKVAKSKKDVKTKKEDGVKSEPDLEGYAEASVRDMSPAARVKQEQSQPTYHSQFTPTSASSPSILDCPSGVAGRLLTPCSDDMMASAPSLGMSPPHDLFAAHQAAFDLAAAAHSVHDLGQAHDEHTGLGHAHGHAHGSWTHSPVYSAFDAALDMGHYDVNMCEHRQFHSHPARLHDADAVGEPDEQHIMVKHEELGPHCRI